MNRYAILISCEEYKNLIPTDYCHNDLFFLKETLINYCDYHLPNIIDIMAFEGCDEDNANTIYEKITELCNKMELEDTILFYFAGHGMLIENDAYLALPSYNENDIANTALSITRINTILKEKHRKNFMILDACHSGLNTREITSSSFNDFVLNKINAIFSACSPNELSHSDKKLQNGIFTYYLCKVIKQWNRNSDINIEELKIKVSVEVSKWCELNNYKQTPTLSAYIVGNISFATRNNIISDEDIEIEDNKETSNYSSGGIISMDNNTLDIYKAESQFLWSSACGVSLPKILRL